MTAHALIRGGVLSVVVVVFSACAPKPPPLDLRPVDALLEGGRVVAADAPGPADSADPWWLQVGGDDLGDWIRRAYAANPGVEAARHRADALGALVAAEAARAHPRLAARARFTQERQAVRDSVLGSTQVRENDDRLFVGIGLRWDLDVFGRIDAAERVALERADQGEIEIAVRRLGLAEAIAITWIELGRLNEREMQLQERIEQVRRQVALLERNRRLGDVPAADVLLERARLSELEAQRVATVRDLDSGRQRLMVLAGLPPTTTLNSPTPTLPVMDDSSGGVGVSVARLRFRPDLLAAMADVRIADAELDAEIRERWPSFSIDAEAGFSATRIADVYLGELISSAASAAFDLIDGAQRPRELSRQHERDAVVAEFRAAVLDALLEVGVAVTDLRAANRIVAHSRDQERLANEAWTVSRRSYSGGAATAAEVLLAEQRALDAAQASLLARADRAITVIRLGIAMGHTPDPDHVESEDR